MTELKRYDFDEIAVNLPPKETGFYLATEADRKILELQLALWKLRGEYADLQVYAETERIGEETKEMSFFSKSRDYCEIKVAKIKKKLEEMK